MLETLCHWLEKITPKKTSRQHGCRACGYCCELFGGYLHASSADVRRWYRLGREDLLAMVNSTGWIWIRPEGGKRGDPCPHLRRADDQRAFCAIHDIKPDMCRAYPSLDHGRHCVRGIYIPATPSQAPTLH